MDADDDDILFFFCCLVYKQALRKMQEMAMTGLLLHSSVLRAEAIWVLNERAKRRRCGDADEELSVCSSSGREWRCLRLLVLYTLG